MKILVAIANYGAKNRAHAERLIAEYSAMPFEIDIVVLCEAPKNFGPAVREIVGLPTSDPWSLPFSHRTLFVENASKYDLFIYSEDDTLIREQNIRAFMAACEGLPPHLLAGFVRFELRSDGAKTYPDIHGPFHWVPKSVRRSGDYAYADLSNKHSACYMLTRKQLERAIRSEGYALLPHKGRYDLLCTAATDPYTQCGFERVICLSHLHDFELHHLPNAYIDRIGLPEHAYRLQLGAMQEVLAQRRSAEQLFSTEKLMATSDWDKSYYEPVHEALLRKLPPHARRVLTVGCGAGATEILLRQQSLEVTVMPLDAIIGALPAQAGIRVLPPNFEQALECLRGETFDAILIADMLQHLPDPVRVLSQLRLLLSPRGVLLGNTPNLSFARRCIGRALDFGRAWKSLNGDFNQTGLQLTDTRALKRWLRHAGFNAVEVSLDGVSAIASRRLRRLAWLAPRSLRAASVMFVGGIAD
jgi:2-polyprenyl-3-methyl-5-hydroxy-6-metoxy-1,4-benzoquinol methylase